MKVVGSRGTWIVWVFVFFIWEPKWWLLFSSFTMGSDQNHLPWDLTRILPIKNRFFCLSTIFFHVLFSSHLWKVFWRWCNFWDLGKLGKVFWRRILECKTSPRMPVSTRIVKFLRFGDPYEHSLSTGIHGGGTGTSLKYVLSACLSLSPFSLFTNNAGYGDSSTSRKAYIGWGMVWCHVRFRYEICRFHPGNWTASCPWKWANFHAKRKPKYFDLESHHGFQGPTCS